MAGEIIFDSSMSRLDAMHQMVNPRLTDEQVLAELQANLELLYIKAKNYHWNVKGVGFQGVHEMFDQIQSYAVEAADRVAERMRYYNFPIVATASDYLSKSWFPEGDHTLSQEGMLSELSRTLQTIHDRIIERMDALSCPVSQNMTQDICEQIDKFNYFVKSNMSFTPYTPQPI